MTSNRRAPRWRRVCHVGVSLPLVGLVGCQSYDRVPLDLTAYRDALDQRLTETEPLDAYVDRLDASGATVPEAFDLDDGITPAEGEVVALFYNPELRLVRLEAGVALADFETAGLWEDPVFGFDGAEILSSSAPFEYGLTLSLTIPISGRLAVAKDRAGAAYEAELRRVVDAEWRLRADVRRAWARWASATRRVELIGEAIVQVERIGAITDRLEAAGEISRVEGRLFRVELADLRAGLVEAELEVIHARLELLGLLGVSPQVSVELIDEFPYGDVPDVEDEIARLIASNTSLGVRRAAYKVAEETLRLEVRKQYPDITIGSGYGSEGDDRLLLGVAMPIPILNVNRAGIAEARARREVARAAAEAEYERLVRELAGAKASLEALRRRRERYEGVIIPMVEDQAAELEQIAALGEIDSFLLLETVTRALDAKGRLLELHVAQVDARVTIAQLLGPDEVEAPTPVNTADSPSSTDESEDRS